MLDLLDYNLFQHVHAGIHCRLIQDQQLGHNLRSATTTSLLWWHLQSVSSDAQVRLSGTRYWKPFLIATLSQFLSFKVSATDLPLLPGFHYFLCLLTRCLATAPLKLQPNGAIQICLLLLLLLFPRHRDLFLKMSRDPEHITGIHYAQVFANISHSLYILWHSQQHTLHVISLLRKQQRRSLHFTLRCVRGATDFKLMCWYVVVRYIVEYEHL